MKNKFICKNKKYETNTSKGFKGSVTKKPIYKDDDTILRLEYVQEFKKPKNEIFWFMWYKKDGSPILNESAVFDKDDLLEVLKNIKEIKF